MLLHGTESFNNHDNGKEVSGKMSSSIDMHYKKTGLKVNPSLGMTPTIKYYPTAFVDYILQSVSYLKKDRRGPTLPILPSLGMTTTKTLR